MIGESGLEGAIVARSPLKFEAMPGILIDVMRLIFRRAAGTIPTGIDRVGLEYVRHYADRARAVLSLGPLAAPLSRADSARLFGALLDGADLGRFRLLAARLAAKNTAWNWIRPRAGRSILLNTANLWVNTPYYAAQLRWLGARPVFFVHDLIPITHPEFFRPAWGRRHPARVRTMLAIGRGIIANSRDTERALREYAEREGLACPPVVVAPLAPSVTPVREGGAAPPQPPYFVVVGTIEPRKNHLLLLHLWRRLIEQEGGAAPRLYVVGQRGWECENVVDLLERSSPLVGFVFERGGCSDAELAALLRGARALLMPSFAEGFGLPVVEALAAGVPVIASDLPAFRELAGDIPEYADPLDGARWLELVREYARPDSARRAAQLERIRGFRAPTWKEHFAIVDDFLDSLP
jgi:glycosyltransferase involved in cell wall biosynthesis